MDTTPAEGAKPKDRRSKRSSYTIPQHVGVDSLIKASIEKEGGYIIKSEDEHPGNRRSLSFDTDKQRNARNLSKGLSKPGYVSSETLRRASRSVHIAGICKSVLTQKVTKTKWTVAPNDPAVDAKTLKTKIDKVTTLLKRPNRQGDTWRSFIDKTMEDLLVLDSVFWEKTRYEDGELAELYVVDAASIHPVFNEHGQTNIGIELPTKEGEKVLPVSYLQVLNYSQYGGPESGDIIAAWAYDDAMWFHLHPQGSLEGFGFGLSPLELVLSVVTNILNADNYNSTYFEEGGFPPMILQLVGQMTERDLERYREYMLTELQGHFHRPAIIAGEKEMKAINLKDISNRDMQYMEFQLWLAKLLCVAHGMMPQDIGITDTVGNKDVSGEQKQISEGLGYSSILGLLEEQINLIIEDDFGFDDIHFEWIADDTLSEVQISTVVDQRLKNGTLTINEAREKFGDIPFGSWGNDPTLLTATGFQMLGAEQILDPVEVQEQQQEHEVNMQEAKGGADDETEEKKPFGKSIYTDHYKCFFDDRGYSQPFIYHDLVKGRGMVIKPPVAVNLMSQELEVKLSEKIHGEGVNVPLVEKRSFTDIIETMPAEVKKQFEAYIAMKPEYDSEKWRAKIGGSRRFPYYLVQPYLNGYPLSDQKLIDDMKRDPDAYIQAVEDLAAIWKVEKKLKLGDRRRDQYMITLDKRGWGFDFQFEGDDTRWERTKDSLPDVLREIPELWAVFRKKAGISKSVFSRVLDAVTAND